MSEGRKLECVGFWQALSPHVLPFGVINDDDRLALATGLGSAVSSLSGVWGEAAAAKSFEVFGGALKMQDQSGKFQSCIFHHPVF